MHGTTRIKFDCYFFPQFIIVYVLIYKICIALSEDKCIKGSGGET